MKKLFTSFCVVLLPGLLSVFQAERSIVNNILGKINRNFKKYIIIRIAVRVGAFIIFLGIMGGVLHMNKRPVVFEAGALDLSAMYESSGCSYAVFGFLGPFGETSPLAVANSARIDSIVFVDYDQKNFLFVQQNCVRVYGRRH